MPAAAPHHVFGCLLHQIPLDVRVSLQIELESHRFAILSQVEAGKAKGLSQQACRSLRKKLISERTLQFLRFAHLHLAKVDMERAKATGATLVNKCVVQALLSRKAAYT